MISVVALRGQDPEIRRFIISRLLLKSLEHSEHAAALHVVSVDDRIWVRKLRRVAEVFKNRSCKYRLLAKSPVQIILVVGRLADRVADSALRFHINPSDNIRIYTFEFIPVNFKRRLGVLDKARRTFFRTLDCFGFRSRTLRFYNRSGEFLLNILIFIIGGGVAMKYCKKLIPRVNQDCKCSYQDNCSYYVQTASFGVIFCFPHSSVSKYQ